MNATVSVLSAQWTTLSGVPNRYFAIPYTRAGHGLIFGTPGGAWTAVSTMNLIGTYSAGTTGAQVLLPWFTVFATAPASTSATDFLADRSTGEKAAGAVKAVAGVGDVRAGAWATDSADYPLSWVQVQVESREAGHAFTVHGTVPGAPDQLLRVTARADATNAILGFALGTGTHFWITRDAEDGAANQPMAPAAAAPLWTASPAATFSALLIFPDPPGRPSALVWHNFYVNARTRPDHQFSVRMSDGYTSTFGPVANGSVSGYEQRLLWGYLSDYTYNDLPAYYFQVLVDPTVMLTLLDTTNGTQLGVSPDSNYTTWYDGWESWLRIPVPDPGATPAISLRLPSAHVMDLFRLRRLPPDSWSSYLGVTGTNTGSRTMLSLQIGGSISRIGLGDMGPYSLEYSTAGFYHPLPAETGPFLVENATTLQTRDGIFAGLNDLTEWFEPPKPIALQISSSRQGHRLVVRHPNGEFFPIHNGNVAGCTSAPAGSPPWYQSYYYFDALAVARSELPWYVEDVDTGERLGAAITLAGPTTGSTVSFSSNTTARVMPINPLAGPSNSDLINWIAVPTPGLLTGASSATTGVISLQWPLANLASDQGGFEVERQLGGQGWTLQGWTLLPPTVAAAAADENGFLHFSDPSPVLGFVHSYRVRYAYGAGAARRRSAPSNAVALSGWLDRDSDGLPDWWESAHGLDPTQGSGDNGGGDGDFDHDGVTNYEEYTYGTDPNNPGSMPFKVVRSLPETYQYSPQYGYAPNGAIVVYLDKSLPASVSSLPASFVQKLHYYPDGSKVWEPVSGSTLILPGRKTVAFLPAANLQPRPPYVYGDGGESADCNYRIEFTTATTGFGAATATGTEALIPFHAPFSVREDSDTIGAWVRQTWPGYNHISVAKTFAPVVEWSEPLLPASVVPSNVSLQAEGGTADLPVTVGFDYATNRLTITPAGALAADTRYTVTLLNPTATGFRNLMGTPLFSPYTWSFRTRPDPVPPVVGEGPYVTDTVPAAYAGNVQPGAAVQITFSEAMDETTLTTATVHLRAARESTDVPVTTSYDSGTRCLTLSLEVDLAYSTHYDIVLDAAALLSSAAIPQALQAQATFSFVTAADPGSGGGGGGGGGGGPGGEKKPDAPEPLTLAFRYGDPDRDAGGYATVEITPPGESAKTQKVVLPPVSNGMLDYVLPNIPPDATIRVTPQFSRGSDPNEEEEKDEVRVTVGLDPASANDGSKYLVFRQSGSSPDWEYLGPLSGGLYTAMFQPAPLAPTAAAGSPPPTQTLHLLRVEMVPDFNGDGVIDDNDRGKATESKPYRFWLNDDDDSISINEFPSTKRDYTTPQVDGAQDLWDFFPVFLDIQQLVKALPPGPTVKYKLKQADGAVNFVQSNLTRENAFTYQNGLILPNPPKLETGFGTNFTLPPHNIATYQVTAEGVELTTQFLNNIKDHNQGVILVEGRTPTTKPLLLTVEKDGVQVAELSLPLALNARILLLLHGMNSNTATWDDFVDQKIGHSTKEWAADIKVDDRRLPNNAPMLASHGVRCYRLQFGGFEDKDTPRKGVEDISTNTANAGRYLSPRPNRCGDFETFEQLGQEIDDAIGLLLADPKYVNAQIFLMGHSRGGLAARAFLQGQTVTPTLANRAAVVGLLTTGTPHRGSPIGKIYQWLKTNNRNTNPSDWAVVDKLKAGLEKEPIEVGVDVRRPVVDDMADDSTAIASLNAAVGLLPDNIRYGQITYKKSALGRLKRLLGNVQAYSVFNEVPGVPRFSSGVKNILLGAGRTPDEVGYLGDGLIPAENQKFPQSFLDSHKVSELVVTADDVLHAEEPGRADDLRSKLHDLMPTWFP